MDLVKLKEQLTIDEGRRYIAYKDTNGIWTNGLGHTGKDVHPLLQWTDTQIDDAYARDISGAIYGAKHVFQDFDNLNDVRQNVLVNMCFQLGIEGLLKFEHMLSCLRMESYLGAANQMLASLWAKQCPARADRLAKQMLTGEW